MQSHQLKIASLPHHMQEPSTSQDMTKRKKQPLGFQVVALEDCRGTVTRTQDPLVPNQMR